MTRRGSAVGTSTSMTSVQETNPSATSKTNIKTDLFMRLEFKVIGYGRDNPKNRNTSGFVQARFPIL